MSDVHLLIGLSNLESAGQVIDDLKRLSSSSVTLEKKVDSPPELLVRTPLSGFFRMFEVMPAYSRKFGWHVARELGVPEVLRAHVQYLKLSRNQPYLNAEGNYYSIK